MAFVKMKTYLKALLSSHHWRHCHIPSNTLYYTHAQMVCCQASGSSVGAEEVTERHIYCLLSLIICQ